MQQPAWLERAWADLGQREVAGAGDNPRIVDYYKEVGFPDVRHDEVAWCAAFVGACLERSGVLSTRLLLARSYLAFGETIAQGRPGAIAVLSRGNDPASGHVGFWVGESEALVYLLGGNQGDAVSVQAFDKSRLLGLRWPVAVGAVPVQSSKANERQPEAPPIPSHEGAGSAAAGHAVTSDADPFAAALVHVLEMEGGWTEDPYDPGGPTNFGITLATFASWEGEILDGGSTARLVAALKAISPATVRDIYCGRYWQPSRSAELPPPLGFMHFDASVNHGVGGAARMLQSALGVEADGDIGPETLAAAATCRPGEVVAGYAEIRRRKYRSLGHFWRFGRGWLARVDATEKKALAMPGVDRISEPTTRKGSGPMTDATQTQTEAQPGKWWGESMTIWGVIITTLSTVLPIVGPLIGLDISSEMVHQIGAQATNVMQAIGGLIGTLLTVYGRSRAILPLARREVRVKL